MKYCQTCITPYNRPNIQFDANGKCNCATKADKDAIDWNAREKLFRDVVANAKSRSGGYDCLIPVSGGKDSHWQVVQCLEYGLKPLAVTWRPPGRTPIGQENLENLVRLGVDHIDYAINPKIEKRFTYLAFKKYGIPALPMHLAIFNVPITVAVRFKIPLVVWGENSAFEYGGEDEARRGFTLDSNWVRKYGVTHGTTAADWVSEELTRSELTPYFGPTDEEIAQAGVSAVFLGYYFRWDPSMSYEVAAKHGFKRASTGAKTGYYDYADIDDDFISIHHWMKWYKFGFTRTFDNLSLEVRSGRLTREAAIDMLRKRGDETPRADIAKFCDWLGITQAHFYEICDSFRSKDVWTKKDGKWEIDGFLVDGWSWT